MNKNNQVPTSTLFVRSVPRSLHKAFKAWCVLRGITMQDKLISLMRETIKEAAVKN
jgi:hypothetical protein